MLNRFSFFFSLLFIISASSNEPSRLQLNLFSEFVGPSLDFKSPLTTYQVFSLDQAPLRVFVSGSAQYQLSKDNSNHWLGIYASLDQNLQSGVINQFGYEISKNLLIYDPSIYWQFYNLVNLSDFYTNFKLSMDLPLSEFSRSVRYITNLNPSFAFRWKAQDPRFYYGFNLDAWYSFFENMVGFNRLSVSIGHKWGYYIKPNFSIDTYSVLDFALRAGTGEYYQFHGNSMDRFRVSLYYKPILYKLQLGCYLQGPLYTFDLSKTTVGLNIETWL